MNFVDRIEETARLRDALSREKSSLVVVYGRRRLGKSTLIKRVLSDSDVYFLADRSEGQHQRILLAKVVAQVFPDFDKLTYPDWESLFRALNYRTDKRFTLCLDEFPYLVEQSPELPSVLQKLVDEKQLKYNLVLCGSSQNMMYGLFLDSTAPLYGRADEIMRLAPIRLPYIQEALNLDAVGAVEEYAVWGGVPRYWELRENRNSLSDALWQERAVVQLQADFRHPGNHLVDRPVLRPELTQLVFGDGEIGIHLRIVRHHCKRLFDGGTDECADAVRQRAYNPVARTLDFGVRFTLY